MPDYIDFGKKSSSEKSNIEIVNTLRDKCISNRFFRFIEMRTYSEECDTIIVDCFNTNIPNRNEIGIKNRERLALVYDKRNHNPFDVRALRADFPVTLHQNSVPKGEPASLCLYFESWSALERYWTPETHLIRILWWLEETASGTLHRNEQPLEQLYFESQYKIVLPIDFNEKVKQKEYKFFIDRVNKTGHQDFICHGLFEASLTKSAKQSHFDCIALELEPVLHSRINKFPYTLGELHDQLYIQGSELIVSLINLFKNNVDSSGLSEKDESSRTLLLLSIPMKRKINLPEESIKIKGFIIDSSIGNLGVDCGVLFKNPANCKYFKESALNLSNDNTTTVRWRNIEILTVEVIPSITKEFARVSSNIDISSSDFNAVLAGVGALGSLLADIWAKEAWGEWTFIDDDYIRPHNIVRHLARANHIGWPKATICEAITNSNYQIDYFKNKSINEKANNFKNPNILEAVNNAKLIVDATTTIEVQRDISDLDVNARAASVFLTPSGFSSVLLLEDAERENRLDTLEAQYYRAIINSTWGNRHLDGNLGELWVGAGCRDISVKISQEQIMLHAAILARQLRISTEQIGPVIRIWESNDEFGAIMAHDIKVHKTNIETVSNWRIVIDDGIINKINTERLNKLPYETGGIIVGYIDQKSSKIFIVDVLNAPNDSISEKDGFQRGIDGLTSELDRIGRLTGNIVEYIGEWHSHPQNTTALPSYLDCILLKYLADILAKEGKPAIMIIAGDNEINYALMKAKNGNN